MKLEKEIGWLLKEKYFDKPSEKFDTDVKRLKVGEPLAYVIGFVDFLGCKIDVSKKPLIPRLETEFWVSNVVESLKLKVESGDIRVLDIFAGSGCIGVAVLKNIKASKVTFIEKDKNLLTQIKINCKINNIDAKKYKIKQSDIFKNVKGKFDYIFSNPPYIPLNHKKKIQKSVLAYEPKMALFGGKDGLFYIKKFLAIAKYFLNSDGKIYMEFDPPQKKELQNLLLEYSYKTWEFKKDQYDKFRYVIIYK